MNIFKRFQKIPNIKAIFCPKQYHFIRKPIYSFCTKNNNQNDDENMSITHEMDVEMLEKSKNLR